MSKIFHLLVIFFLFLGCSFNKNSKFWTKAEKIEEESFSEVELFTSEKEINKELNKNIKINFSTKPIKIFKFNQNNNNYGRVEFNGNLKKVSKYKFSKIDNFYKYEPTISFDKTSLIFFDNKGSILKFNDSLTYPSIFSDGKHLRLICSVGRYGDKGIIFSNIK